MDHHNCRVCDESSKGRALRRWKRLREFMGELLVGLLCPECASSEHCVRVVESKQWEIVE